MSDKALLRELRAAHRALQRASEARRALPPGSSRARVTSANARLSTASSQYERIRAQAIEAGLARDVEQLEAQ